MQQSKLGILTAVGLLLSAVTIMAVSWNVEKYRGGSWIDAVFLVIVAWSIFRQSKWAYWSCGIVGTLLVMAATLGPMLFGIGQTPWFAIVFLLAGGMALAVFYDRSFRKTFQLSERAKRISRWVGCGILLLLGLWVGAYLTALTWLQKRTPVYGKTLLLIRSKTPRDPTWRSWEIGSIQIKLPPDQKLFPLKNPELKDQIAFWKSPKTRTLIMLDLKSGLMLAVEEIEKHMPILSKDSPFDTAKSMLSDRTGLIFGIVNSITRPDHEARIDEFECGLWHGFVQSYKTLIEGRETCFQVYSLWHRPTGESLSLTFVTHNLPPNPDEIGQILSSLELSKR